MTGLPRLKTIRLQNFMRHADSTFTFDDSNVLQIDGYNSNGKSSVIRALGVVLYNIRPNDLVKEIRWGADSFTITLTFEDGVQISRSKQRSGASEWRMVKGSQTLFTNVMNTGRTHAVHDVPECIREYLGVLKDEATGECFNLRATTDKRFLIQTTGGENYKMLNNSLKAEVLTQASASIVADKNAALQEESVLLASLQSINTELENCQVASEDSIEQIKICARNCITLNERMSNLTKALGVLSKAQSIRPPKEINFDTSIQERALMLNHLMDKLTIASREVHPELQIISLERLFDLTRLLTIRDRMSILLPEECNVIDLTRYNALLSVIGNYNSLCSQTQKLSEVESSLNQARQDLKSIAQAEGVLICNDCGAVIEGSDDHGH